MSEPTNTTNNKDLKYVVTFDSIFKFVLCNYDTLEFSFQNTPKIQWVKQYWVIK